MMISTQEFKNGICFIHNNTLYRLISFQHVNPGKGAAFVRTKLRNLRTGSVNEITFNAGEKVDQVEVVIKKMQYLYGGETYCFMDMETFDQVEIPSDMLEWEKQFLVEGLLIDVLFYESEVLGVMLPDKLEYLVTEACHVDAGNTATNALKEVTIETGLIVKVPLFVEQDDRIIVSTVDGKYSGKAK